MKDLPKNCTEKDLKFVGEKFGDVVEAKMQLGKDRLAMNVGSILFQRQSEATRFCKLVDGRMLNGKVVTASYHPEKQ